MNLDREQCEPCERAKKPLTQDEIQSYFKQIKGWTLSPDASRISKEITFIDFKSALGFVNEVGDIAEFEGHHPDINIHDWNKVTITLSTHRIKGLTKNDFIIAVKIDGVIADADK